MFKGEKIMIRFFQKNIEPNRKLRIVEVILLVLLIIGSIASYVIGFSAVRTDVGQLEFVQSIEMQRDFSMEDYDGEEDTVCDVTYRSGDKELVVTYSYEEYEQLDNESITAYEFEAEDGTQLYFDHQDVTQAEAQSAYEQIMANESMPVFNFANASMILVLSLLIMMLFARQFTTYEKSWFMSIMVLATIFSVMSRRECQRRQRNHHHVAVSAGYLLKYLMRIADFQTVQVQFPCFRSGRDRRDRDLPSC